MLMLKKIKITLAVLTVFQMMNYHQRLVTLIIIIKHVVRSFDKYLPTVFDKYLPTVKPYRHSVKNYVSKQGKRT